MKISICLSIFLSSTLISFALAVHRSSSPGLNDAGRENATVTEMDFPGFEQTKPKELLPPEFYLPGGEYDFRFFDLELALGNPNDSARSEMYYSINFGEWKLYTSAHIFVPPNAEVRARVVALDDSLLDSEVRMNKYEAKKVKLTSPTILIEDRKIGYLRTEVFAVALEGPDQFEYSSMRYRINGGSWKDYSSPFLLQKDLFPNGARIEAKVVSESDYWLPSPVTSRHVSS